MQFVSKSIISLHLITFGIQQPEIVDDVLAHDPQVSL